MRTDACGAQWRRTPPLTRWRRVLPAALVATALGLVPSFGGCTSSSRSGTTEATTSPNAAATTAPTGGDAEAAALAFVRSLGLAQIDLVTGTGANGDQQAQVGVGFRDPDGIERTVAVLRLRQLGSVSPPSWEVVDSAQSTDSRLRLTDPAAGASVHPPLRISGRLSGVDETVQVVVRSLPALTVLGTADAGPITGTDVPWAATVALSAESPGPALIEVITSGSLSPVQSLAVRRIRLTG